MTSPKGVSPSAAAQAGKSLQTSSFFNINSTFTAESSSTPSVLITDHPKITAITENCSGIHFLNLTTEIRNTIYSYALDIECERTPRPMNYINSNKSARAQERSPQSILEEAYSLFRTSGKFHLPIYACMDLANTMHAIYQQDISQLDTCQKISPVLTTIYTALARMRASHVQLKVYNFSKILDSPLVQCLLSAIQYFNLNTDLIHHVGVKRTCTIHLDHFWSDSWQEIMPYHLLPRIVSEMKKKTRENWTLAYYIHTEYGGECAIQPYDTVEHDIFVDIMKRWIGNAPIALRAEVYGKGKSPEYLEWSDQLKSIITSDVKETSIWQGYSEWIHGLYKRGFRQNYGL